MAISTRERYISFAAVLAGAILAADRLAWSPYLEHRSALLEQRDAKRQAVADAQNLLIRERRLRSILAKMGPSLEADTSTAEMKLLHLFHDWEQQSGVNGAAFHRVRAVDEGGFTHMSFFVSGSGPSVSVATLIYAIETAGVPLRIDDLRISPKREGEELQIQLSVSTLCRKNTIDPRQRGAATETASLDHLGGRP